MKINVSQRNKCFVILIHSINWKINKTSNTSVIRWLGIVSMFDAPTVYKAREKNRFLYISLKPYIIIVDCLLRNNRGDSLWERTGIITLKTSHKRVGQTIIFIIIRRWCAPSINLCQNFDWTVSLFVQLSEL